MPSKVSETFKEENNKLVSRTQTEKREDGNEEFLTYETTLLPFDLGLEILNVNLYALEEWMINYHESKATIKISSQTLSSLGNHVYCPRYNLCGGSYLTLIFFFQKTFFSKKQFNLLPTWAKFVTNLAKI